MITQAGARIRPRAFDRRPVTYPVTDGFHALKLSSRSENGYVVAALAGELGLACAPTLREQLFGLLRTTSSQLVVDLSALSPTVAKALRFTGLDRQLRIFPTVQAAITGQESA